MPTFGTAVSEKPAYELGGHMLGISRAAPVAAEVDRAAAVEAGREPGRDGGDRVVMLRERGDHGNTVAVLGEKMGVVHGSGFRTYDYA